MKKNFYYSDHSLAISCYFDTVESPDEKHQSGPQWWPMRLSVALSSASSFGVQDATPVVTIIASQILTTTYPIW